MRGRLACARLVSGFLLLLSARASLAQIPRISGVSIQKTSEKIFVIAELESAITLDRSARIFVTQSKVLKSGKSLLGPKPMGFWAKNDGEFKIRFSIPTPGLPDAGREIGPDSRVELTLQYEGASLGTFAATVLEGAPALIPAAPPSAPAAAMAKESVPAAAAPVSGGDAPRPTGPGSAPSAAPGAESSDAPGATETAVALAADAPVPSLASPRLPTTSTAHEMPTQVRKAESVLAVAPIGSPSRFTEPPPEKRTPRPTVAGPQEPPPTPVESRDVPPQGSSARLAAGAMLAVIVAGATFVLRRKGN
ncbi:MAG: hypothetical protein ABIT01_18215, partial [Thermoanaerobaculia bacterium]